MPAFLNTGSTSPAVSYLDRIKDFGIRLLFPFLIRFSGTGFDTSAASRTFTFSESVMSHLSPAPFSAVFKPVFSFVIRSRYKILISPFSIREFYIFHPLFALLRVVCILSETMPSGFLSGCQMCDHCLTHDQSFAKFINLHQFISICCCQSVNYWLTMLQSFHLPLQDSSRCICSLYRFLLRTDP